MDKKLAEKTSLVVLQVSYTLDAFLVELKGKLDDEEFKAYCQKFGKVMGPAYLEILKPLWEEHPELKPEKMGGPCVVGEEVYQKIYKLIAAF